MVTSLVGGHTVRNRTCVGSQAAWLQNISSSRGDLGFLLSQETQPPTSHQSLGANQTPSSRARQLGTMPFRPEAPNLTTLSLKQVSQEAQNPNEV